MIDLSHTPWRWLTLSERHGIVCLIDVEDYEIEIARNWNYGWKKRGGLVYAKRNVGVERSTVYLHREIAKRAEPIEDWRAACMHVDHKNGQTLDNRWRDRPQWHAEGNLRWATPAENIRNRVERKPSLDQIVRRLMNGHKFEEIPGW